VIEGDDKCATELEPVVKTTNTTQLTLYPAHGEEVTDPVQDAEMTMQRYFRRSKYFMILFYVIWRH
jgi:hypothetical protein